MSAEAGRRRERKKKEAVLYPGKLMMQALGNMQAQLVASFVEIKGGQEKLSPVAWYLLNDLAGGGAKEHSDQSIERADDIFIGSGYADNAAEGPFTLLWGCPAAVLKICCAITVAMSRSRQSHERWR